MNSSTEASRSKPMRNTKKDRILQSSSGNKKKNKVEDHLRIAKSSLNNKNRVSNTVYYADVKHTTLNANSELICVKCNQCMFDENHDVYFLEFVNYVNVRSKSKSDKKSKNKNIWKPSKKVFTKIGYRWKPTGRTFTIVGNTSPKATKSVGLSSKSKIVESKISNNLKPNKSWGSNASDVPSSSLINSRLSKLFSGIWTLEAQSICQETALSFNFVHKFLGTIRF
nr:hypothetical protein [Tanacetum cinerariifolium]